MRIPQAPRALAIALSGLALLAITPAARAAELSYYLPDDTSYDSSIPTPESVLGFEVGEWHVRHDLLVNYMRALAEASPRAILEIQGTTHEKRPQPLLIVTSEANHARLEEIRLAHLARTDPATEAPSDQVLAQMPVVIFLGYSIHGNEASGANAALLATYHFVAGQGPKIEDSLEKAVILFDPSLNPDGLGRFAQWVNTHRSTGPLVGDSSSREHNEIWPGGRTNHYWFDLNRDWLLLQHPESRNRVRTLHRWKPNLIGDFHEMGTDSTFFFQPGVPIRKNPLIPEKNLEITQRLAEFHARLLEADQRLFYTKEGYDDFYPGKGSTYPDLQGGIGVLFEQASARGHLQDSANGDLAFHFGIKNHFLASLSMVEGAVALRRDFLAHQVDFLRQGYEEAAKDARAAFVYQIPKDPARQHLMDMMLLRHDIEVHRLAEPIELEGVTYSREASIVALRQRQYYLIRTLFETMVDYADTTFYDVSTWTLPLAWNAQYSSVGESFDRTLLGDRLELEDVAEVEGRVAPGNDPYVYLFDWDRFYAPRALYRLQRAGLRARVATQAFTATTTQGERDFERGTIVVPTGLGKNGSHDLDALMQAVAEKDGVDVHKATSGLTPNGIDLGSPSLRPVDMPRPAILAGGSTRSYEAGEIWHLLDHRFGIEATVLDTAQLRSTSLDRYTHLLMPGGFYASLPESSRDKILEWVRAGGTVVSQTSASSWVQTELLGRNADADEFDLSADRDPTRDSEGQSEEDKNEQARRSYADYRAERAEQLVSGTIVQAELDLTHPLAYGYDDKNLPMFRTSVTLLPKSDNPYENVAFYSEDPLLSGYISSENRVRLGNGVAVMASRVGSGVVIQFLDNLNFRAYFHGTTKLYLNSLFLSGVIDLTSAPDSWLEGSEEASVDE